MSNELSHLLIVGCGYVGRRLALRMRDHFEVTALVRTRRSAQALEAQGVNAITMDLDRVRAGAFVPERLDQTVVYLAPPPPSGESDLRLDRFLQLLITPPRTFVYLSTTGVYGDASGAVVDESSPVQPRTPRARRRVSAEEMLRVWCTERCIRRVVLRAPGIYGPGRLPLDRLRRGEPVLRREDAPVGNRIHVDDLVEACSAAIENPQAVGVYTLSDGTPLSSTDFLDLLARLTGLPPAPQITMEEAQLTFSAERLSFLGESRRVSNDRMIRDLGVRPRYANVEAGLRQSLSEENASSGQADSQAG